MAFLRPSSISAKLINLERASSRTLDAIANCFVLYENYLDRHEHEQLILEAHQSLRKASWSAGHFDSVIVNYREMTISRLESYLTMHRVYTQRITPEFFLNKNVQLPHVLELAPDGYILPHLDSYCGDEIVGLSLVSPRTIRFRHKKDYDDHFDVILPPASLYCHRGQLRWDFEHEVLMDGNCQGRISILFRTKPSDE